MIDVITDNAPDISVTPKTRHSVNEEARRVAVELMRAGMAGPNEIAQLLGMKHQTVRNWQHSAKIDWRAARKAWVQKAWRRLA